MSKIIFPEKFPETTPPTVDKKLWFFGDFSFKTPIFRGLGFASPMFFINFWPTTFHIFFVIFSTNIYVERWFNACLLRIGFFRLVFLEPFSKGILCTRFGIHVSRYAKWTQNSHTFRLSYVNGLWICNWRKYQHVLFLFWWFHINIRPTKRWFFHFFWKI